MDKEYSSKSIHNVTILAGNVLLEYHLTNKHHQVTENDCVELIHLIEKKAQVKSYFSMYLNCIANVVPDTPYIVLPIPLS